MTSQRVENTAAIHLLFVGSVGFALYVCRKLIKPNKALIPCSDSSINLPLLSETITTAHIIAYLCLIPPLLILVVEFLRWRSDETDWFPVHSCTLFGFRISKFAQCLYLNIGTYLYGAALAMLTVEFGKKTAGRLRPHFMQACKPLNFNIKCSPSNTDSYANDIICSDESAEIIARESFPSAHSAATVYTATFLFFYLQLRMSWKSVFIPILRPSIQIAFIQIAFVVALTRVRDHFHFYSDIAAGSLIGFICAIIIVFYMSPLRWSYFGCRFCSTAQATAIEEQISEASDSCSVPNVRGVPRKEVTSAFMEETLVVQ